MPNPIELHLSPTSIVMERDGVRIESSTSVTFVRKGTQLLPIIPGLENPVGPESFSITLFGPSSTDSSNDKSACLAALFFGMARPLVIAKFLRVKPRFIVKGSKSLAPILAGYQNAIVRAALEPIAMSITFEAA